MLTRHAWKVSFMRVHSDWPASRNFNLIFGHALVGGGGCNETAPPVDLPAVRENLHVARVPPARDRVRKPKQLMRIRQQKGTIPSRGAMLFDIQSKVRPQRVNPSTSIRLHVS